MEFFNERIFVMIILPAIDIKDGSCVRLFRGDYATAHKVAEDPLRTACTFHAAGAEWVHMVDLDGAKDAAPKNRDIFLECAAKSGAKIEVGGGIRSIQIVEDYLQNGISRVILGSAALKNPGFVQEAAQKYGEQIAVGIDARAEMVAAEGWLSTSSVHYLELARQMEQIGVRTLIFTDISRDGMLQGPNLEQLAALQNAVSCRIIASGGISSLEDICACRQIGMYGAICGKAIYTGALNLREAIAAAE